MTNFVLDNFLDELDTKLTGLFAACKNSVNKLYNRFVTIFSEVAYKFAPIRKASRKEKKLKLRPRITSGLLKSIKTKNKMLKILDKNLDDLALTELIEMS